MKRPIRLNRDFLRRAWPNLQRGCPDPRGLLNDEISAKEATEIIAKIKINGVFKTTRADRYPRTARLLADSRFPVPPVILDVGASDGSTSLSIMEALRFTRYYVTDRHIEARVCLTKKGAFFCDVENNPFMYTNRFLVIYNDVNKAIWPMPAIVRRLFSGFEIPKSENVRTINLMNPALLSRVGDDIRLHKYDIFEPWCFEKVDLVIAANILNRSYFPEIKLKAALQNLRGALKESGRLAVIENRSTIEQSTIFRLYKDRFIIESEVGRGSDIKPLVTSLAAADVDDGHSNGEGLS